MDADTFVERYQVERRNTDSLKWDALGERFGNPDLLPMWVADTEFRAPEAVLDAMTERVAHGAFGYSMVPDSYFEAFDAWAAARRQARVSRQWVRFSPGVVTSFYWMIGAFTEPGDAVLLTTPVYYPMHNAIRDTGRRLVTSELVRDENGEYGFDLEDFERTIVDAGVRQWIACSPHNPVSRVWSEDELDAVLGICAKHDVTVVADEIHQDILPGDRPFVAMSEVAGGRYRDRVITLSAVSKTFNLAALAHSHIIIHDDALRARYDAWTRSHAELGPNVLGVVAAEAAWRGGAEWLEALTEVIRRNDATFRARVREVAPTAQMPPLEGTYLLWLDLRDYVRPDEMQSFMQDTCGLAVDYGEWFSPHAKGFVRFNLATTPALLDQGVEQLVNGLSGLG
ncbi:MAG: pyridoxal phosphate-dependent aminotransferase [Propionibacteriaceae bacterium]|uniref:cysteine-S-conjugate beta-lyase n=1 Tax=Propionibacterium ruminifibrarum TaxID=1962131 RepID=A0A375I6A4_9ACTN|nr:MalY/PatB family protein [Propionibacterium ruminifibrarum]MBE6476716.1 pyridoxal phosphate-dependent aminotransferase [Propionibacteriaceae bacterium]SPF69025.1 Aminotransferase class I and II [Propionibacterium ruminifibrarum]